MTAASATGRAGPQRSLPGPHGAPSHCDVFSAAAANAVVTKLCSKTGTTVGRFASSRLKRDVPYDESTTTSCRSAVRKSRLASTAYSKSASAPPNAAIHGESGTAMSERQASSSMERSAKDICFRGATKHCSD